MKQRRRYLQFILFLRPNCVVNQRFGVHRRGQWQTVTVGAVGAHWLVEKLWNTRKETKSIKEAWRAYFEAVIIGRIMEPRLAKTIKLERRGEEVVEMIKIK